MTVDPSPPVDPSSPVDSSPPVDPSPRGGEEAGGGGQASASSRFASWRLPEPALKIVGIVVIVLLGAMTALYEVLYSPLRAGTVRIPVSLVLAVVLNPLLALGAYWTTGRRLAALLPGLAWCIVFFAGASKTREGDLLLTDNNWVGLVTLLAGPIAFAVAVFVPIMREQQRMLRGTPPPEAARPAVVRTPSKAPAPGSKPKKAAAPLRQPARKR